MRTGRAQLRLVQDSALTGLEPTKAKSDSPSVATEVPIPSAWKDLAGADLAELFLDRLRERVAPLDAKAIQDLVKRGEKVTREGAHDLRKKKLNATPGQEIPLSMSRVRPGQTQISYDHVRTKLLELLDALKASPKDVISRFLAGDRLTGFVSASGHEVILTDGHHKFTALLALRGLVGMSMFGGTHIPMLFTEERPLYLEHRGAKKASKAPPSGFAALEDNPYRKLAAELAVKLRGGPGEYRLEGFEHPLWIKGPGASDFIEFYLAARIEAALKKAHLSWEPGTKLSGEGRAVVRATLKEMADPQTQALDENRGAIFIPADWTKAEVLAHLKVGRKRGRLKLVGAPEE